MNLNDIKAKLEALEKRDSGQGYKPKDGDQKIRVTPSPDGDSLQEVFMHFRIAGQSFLCPKKNFGEPCALCDFASELYKLGDEASLDMSKQIYAKPRYYSPILVRGEEEKGIRWWSYGVKVYKMFLKKYMDPEYGNFTDPETGFDWTLSYTPQEKSSTNFAESELTPARASSKMIEGGKKKVDELVAATPKLFSILPRKTSEETKELLDKFLSRSPEDSSSETEKYGEKSGSSEKTKLDQAFDELKEDV
jgi:serine/threonine protein kinase